MKRDFSVAIQKSAATTILAAAPATGPSTLMMTGLGRRFIAKEISLTNSAIFTKDWTSSSLTALCISAKSPPTEKTFPLALITKNLTDSSLAASSIASKISSHIGILKPFETSGRLKVIVATSSAT